VSESATKTNQSKMEETATSNIHCVIVVVVIGDLSMKDLISTSPKFPAKAPSMYSSVN